MQIPTYILGVVCILVGKHFVKTNPTSSGSSLSIWAFLSGVLLASIPVFDFVMPGFIFGFLIDPFVITWLPIVTTSVAYLAIKK